jgi:uncharacterized membrane protein YdbT with pleckstrin-like domain
MTPIDLQPNEAEVHLSRRHWVVLYPLLVLDALLGVVPLVLAIWVATKVDSNRAQLAILGIAVVWVLAIALRAYFRWYRYHHDVWLITNQRLIDSLRRHWFHRKLASADLVDIEDVSMERHGVLQTLLDFGNLRVQTAGEQENFMLRNIHHPADVLTTLDLARDEARHEVGRTV